MKVRIYKPSKGAQFNAEQAQVLGQVIEQLGDTATPKQLVDAARSKKSPIHSLFEWDDSAAAEQYRLFQARNHINHLHIVFTTRNEEGTTKAFHSVVISDGESSERVYASMATVADNQELADQVIAKALAELHGWKVRYAQYQQVFSGVFQAIGEADKKVRRRRRKAVA
jgi:hypothetical protein